MSAIATPAALPPGLAFLLAPSPAEAERRALAAGLTPLGGLSPSVPADAGSAPWLPLNMPVLGSSELASQLWCLPGPVSAWQHSTDTGVHLHARVARDAQFLLAESRVDGPLATQARHLYTAVLGALRGSGHPHPIRFWNYLADIHGTEGGEERYRRFNQGRREAMQALGCTITEGAPAACALGNREGRLRVAVLSGAQAPRAIENPRQVSAYHYPAQYGRTPPVFSRAALLPLPFGRDLLLISGTASIVGHQSLHEGDVQAQTEEALRNIESLLAQACAGRPALSLSELSGRVYVRHPADVPRVLDRLVARGMTGFSVLQAEVCRRELLVEIEAEGWVTHAG